MQNHVYQARAAAFWMAHAACLARLLRAHGQELHAINLEAAMNEVAEIVARQVGRQTLAQAMGWASSRLEEADLPVPAAGSISRH